MPKIMVQDEEGEPMETEVSDEVYSEMMNDIRYEHVMCPVCKQSYQRIDWNCAVHDMMCPKHPRKQPIFGSMGFPSLKK